MAPTIDRTDREAAGLNLLAHYDEPHRAYHNQQHLAEVIAAVALLAEHAHDLSAVMLAAWWHDAVYQPANRPEATSNEAASAALAVATLEGWNVDHSRCQHIAALIQMTSHHLPSTGDADAQVLSDADLAILASPPHRYTAYAADVRREYCDIPDPAFVAGRTAVLDDLLARDQIYCTPSAHHRWEHDARVNLATELGQLNS